MSDEALAYIDELVQMGWPIEEAFAAAAQAGMIASDVYSAGGGEKGGSLSASPPDGNRGAATRTTALAGTVSTDGLPPMFREYVEEMIASGAPAETIHAFIQRYWATFPESVRASSPASSTDLGSGTGMQVPVGGPEGIDRVYASPPAPGSFLDALGGPGRRAMRNVGWPGELSTSGPKDAPVKITRSNSPSPPYNTGFRIPPWPEDDPSALTGSLDTGATTGDTALGTSPPSPGIMTPLSINTAPSQYTMPHSLNEELGRGHTTAYTWPTSDDPNWSDAPSVLDRTGGLLSDTTGIAATGAAPQARGDDIGLAILEHLLTQAGGRERGMLGLGQDPNAPQRTNYDTGREYGQARSTYAQTRDTNRMVPNKPAMLATQRNSAGSRVAAAARQSTPRPASPAAQQRQVAARPIPAPVYRAPVPVPVYRPPVYVPPAYQPPAPGRTVAAARNQPLSTTVGRRR